jgi:chaperone required for assembly of F1-ATPase
MTGGGDIPAPRRAFATATIASVDGGVALILQERRAKTPAGADFVLPGEALAAALAAEWNGARDRRDFSHAPLARLAATAIDRAAERGRWTEEILAFARTDLLCCRAAGPAALVALEERTWTPFLDWAEISLGARLAVGAGVCAAVQPDAALDAIRARLDSFDSWRMLGVRRAVELTGSAILGLALAANAFAADEIFAASRLEERFQREKWGADADAAARERRIEDDFRIAARFLSLLGGGRS